MLVLSIISVALWRIFPATQIVIQSLIPETWTYTCRTNLTQTTTNTATAEGMANGTTVRDSAIATVVVASPKLPNTGLPPREQNTQNNIVVLIGLIAMVSVSFVIVSRNRTV